MWESILTAPFLHMLELAVLDEGTMHSLVPLRKDSGRVEARCYRKACRRESNPLATLGREGRGSLSRPILRPSNPAIAISCNRRNKPRPEHQPHAMAWTSFLGAGGAWPLGWASPITFFNTRSSSLRTRRYPVRAPHRTRQGAGSVLICSANVPGKGRGNRPA